MKMNVVTTTLRQIRQHNPCSEGWRTLLTFLGKTGADDDPLPLVTILQSNGLDDALWCLRTVAGHDKEIARFALSCAQEVKHLMTDQRSLNALDAVARHLESPLSKRELNQVVAEAEAAAEAAGSVWAAVAAAESAALAACVAAAWTAAGAADAAVAAAESTGVAESAAEKAGPRKAAAWAAARARQTQIFEGIFG